MNEVKKELNNSTEEKEEEEVQQIAVSRARAHLPACLPPGTPYDCRPLTARRNATEGPVGGQRQESGGGGVLFTTTGDVFRDRNLSLFLFPLSLHFSSTPSLTLSTGNILCRCRNSEGGEVVRLCKPVVWGTDNGGRKIAFSSAVC